MFVKSCKVSEVEDGYVVQITLQNNGCTPANNIRGNIWLSYSTKYDEDPSKKHTPFPIRPIYLAPSDHKTIYVGRSVKEGRESKMVAALKSGQMSLKLYGEIDFTDQFGKKQKVEIRFKKKHENGKFFDQMAVAGDGLTST